MQIHLGLMLVAFVALVALPVVPLLASLLASLGVSLGVSLVLVLPLFGAHDCRSVEAGLLPAVSSSFFFPAVSLRRRWRSFDFLDLFFFLAFFKSLHTLPT